MSFTQAIVVLGCRVSTLTRQLLDILVRLSQRIFGKKAYLTSMPRLSLRLKTALCSREIQSGKTLPSISAETGVIFVLIPLCPDDRRIIVAHSQGEERCGGGREERKAERLGGGGGWGCVANWLRERVREVGPRKRVQGIVLVINRLIVYKKRIVTKRDAKKLHWSRSWGRQYCTFIPSWELTVFSILSCPMSMLPVTQGCFWLKSVTKGISGELGGDTSEVSLALLQI